MPVSIDQHNAISSAATINPAAARTTSTNGTGVDLANYAAATVVLVNGTVTDGTHTPKIQHSDDNSSFSDADTTTEVSGSFTALTSSSTAGSVQEVSYIGTKRYVRCVITVSGSPSTGGLYSAVVVRGRPRTMPAT